MKRNEILVSRKAHFYSYNSDKPSKNILYVFHGYAQLASDFLAEFEYLKELNCKVVAPEALSKFYGRDRTPVASWMTSHERENEIEDQVAYLDEVHRQISTESNRRVYILAFSQGVSTALRWIKSRQSLNVAQVFLCSGSIPEEIDSKDKLNEKIENAFYFYGDQDRLMKPELAEKAKQKLDNIGLAFEFIPFQGRHEVSWECHAQLKALFETS